MRNDHESRGTDTADERLMERVAEGDDDAFRDLFRRHIRPLLSYFMHLTGDRETAQDLAQETLARIWSTRARYDPARPFRPWLYRIASNARADLERRWWRTLARRTVSLFSPRAEGEAELGDRLAAPDRDQPDRRAESAQAVARVRAALAGLPALQREALVLHELQGLSARETAEVMGRSQATVLSWLSRGRAALRARLGPEART